MNIISKAVLASLELIEAEGALFRKNIHTSADMIIRKTIGSFLIMCSFITIVVALYIWIENQFGLYTAHAITSLVLLIPGMYLLYTGKLRSEPVKNTHMTCEHSGEK